jgi:GNAT superfamily N-acetyltransferase
MISKNDLVEIRDVKPADKNFIYASWLRGLYYGDTWFRDIPKQIFMSAYHRVIEVLLSRPGIEIKVACLKEDPEVILGYAVRGSVDGNTVMHWVFVKAAWRKIGIGRSLMPEGLTAVTHLTKIGKILLPKLPSNPAFNPFLI